MPIVKADPEKMREFGSFLVGYSADLREGISNLRGLFRGLSQFWKDQKRERFEQEFNQAMTELERFINISEKTINYLSRKAEALERYLQT